MHLTVCLFVLSLIFPARIALAADISGSADYPEIGRFASSEIKFYKVESYGQTVFATGPVRSPNDAAKTSQTVEGKITRIVYTVPKGSSALEVFRNFETRAGEAGYRTIFSGGPSEIRSYDFRYKHPVEVLEETSVTDEIRYLFAKKQAGGAEIFLSVLVSPHSGGAGQRVRLIAAETKAMEIQMTDAAKMQRSIGETGRVALYGIYFDSDQATIKPESKPTLDEIAKLLAAQPALKLIVVGHTDNAGSFEHNLDLSKRRAKAVADALVANHGVPSGRLRSDGVGYLAPATTNDTEQGRALNRRVELVKDR